MGWCLSIPVCVIPPWKSRTRIMSFLYVFPPLWPSDLFRLLCWGHTPRAPGLTARLPQPWRVTSVKCLLSRRSLLRALNSVPDQRHSRAEPQHDARFIQNLHILLCKISVWEMQLAPAPCRWQLWVRLGLLHHLTSLTQYQVSCRIHGHGLSPFGHWKSLLINVCFYKCNIRMTM